MKLSKLFFAILGISGYTVVAHSDDRIEDMQEKCYCISRVGQNDCATSLHNCATLSTKDFDCNDWKYVAKGSCADIGGSLIPGQKS